MKKGLERLKQLQNIEESPNLVITDEIIAVNDKLRVIYSNLKAQNNKEVITYQEELKTLIDELKNLTESVVSKDMVVNIPLDNLSNQIKAVEQAIKAIKEVKIPEFPKEISLTEVQINELLLAIQTIPEFPVDSLQSMVNELGKKIEAIKLEVPEFDYYRLERKFDTLTKAIKNISISVSSGGGGIDDELRGVFKTIRNNQTNGTQISQDIDYNGRNSLNTVFGEKIMGIRRADIAAQFQYGFPAGAASQDTNGSGTVSISEAMLVVSTGTDTDGSASIANRKALRYLPGHEAYVYFTAVFSTPKANSYQRAGLFNDNNGFFIGYEGTTFSVTRRRSGTDYSEAITPSNIFDGYDPTKGNIYKISFGYLGFATVSFEVLKPDGTFALIHKIEYPNTETVTHITNTNLTPRATVINDGNDSDIAIKVGSFTAGVVNGGGEDPAARLFTFALSNQTITAGDLMVATFRVKSQFNSLTNYINTILTLMSFNTELSKSSLWKLKKNMTITNTPTWTDIDATDSTIEYSTDATITAGTGDLLFATPLGKVDRILLDDAEKQKIEAFPGDTITLVITTPLGTTGTYDLAFRWKELF